MAVISPNGRSLALAFTLLALLLAALRLVAPAPAQARAHVRNLGDARALTKVGCPVAARRNLLRARRSAALTKRCAKPAPESSHDIYWGAWIGDQLTGDEAPWDMGAVTTLEKITGKSPSLINFSSPFADCSQSPLLLLRLPGRRDGTDPRPWLDPLLQLGLAGDPAAEQPQRARLPALRRDRRALRHLHPQVGRSRQANGATRSSSASTGR